MFVKLFQLYFLFLFGVYVCETQYSRNRDGKEVQYLLREIQKETYRKMGVSLDQNHLNSARLLLNSKILNDGTEAYVNRPFADQLFENDIVLTAPQAKHILNEIRRAPPLRPYSKNYWNRLNQRIRRQIHPDPNLFWKSRIIPYTFSYGNRYWQNNVKEGMQHVEEATCIRFVYNGNGEDYLRFDRARGCWSNIGRVGGGQLVSIGAGCDYLGIIAHEIGHALGLWHEQARTDRDRYVEINYDNVVSGMEFNFYRRSSDTSDNFGMPYDLGSVMHYSPTEFSRGSDLWAITSKDPRYQRTIGQRIGLSFKDAKMINSRYCRNMCSKKLTCQNGGYTDPNNCATCRCPDGYGGILCDQLDVGNTPNCGGLELTGGIKWQSIVSPNLTASMRCYWRIRVTPGDWLALEIRNVSFPCRNACQNFVEIKYHKDKTQSGARFCCDNTWNKIFLSDNHEIIVILNTTPYLWGNYTGFELFYKKHGPIRNSKNKTRLIKDSLGF